MDEFARQMRGGIYVFESNKRVIKKTGNSL